MATQVSYTEARARLAELLDRAEDDRETVIITRRGRPSAAIVALDELESMRETLHLFRSPRNAARLLEAIERAERGEGHPQSIEEFRHEVGLDG